MYTVHRQSIHQNLHEVFGTRYEDHQMAQVTWHLPTWHTISKLNIFNICWLTFPTEYIQYTHNDPLMYTGNKLILSGKEVLRKLENCRNDRPQDSNM